MRCDSTGTHVHVMMHQEVPVVVAAPVQDPEPAGQSMADLLSNPLA